MRNSSYLLSVVRVESEPKEVFCNVFRLINKSDKIYWCQLLRDRHVSSTLISPPELCQPIIIEENSGTIVGNIQRRNIHKQPQTHAHTLVQKGVN